MIRGHSILSSINTLFARRFKMNLVLLRLERIKKELELDESLHDIKLQIAISMLSDLIEDIKDGIKQASEVVSE
jgi:hypothetical protein